MALITPLSARNEKTEEQRYEEPVEKGSLKKKPVIPSLSRDL
jgi:hypothetical protein